MKNDASLTAEGIRLSEDRTRLKNWKRWGPYLSERQWATVREDYSPYGTCWDYFPHDHARSRVYRWGEDGLLGFTDRECRLCFALAVWNGRDPILKERLFGLTGSEGNHGEDVKENYYYLDATPTYSYARALYKYPQVEFPYRQLVEENRRRGSTGPEFELADTGVFDGNRYFDVQIEYAKAGPDDLLIRISATNRGPQAAPVHILPTLWFRNTWSWQSTNEASPKPSLRLETANAVRVEHNSLGNYQFAFDTEAVVLFTENETNAHRLWGTPNPTSFVKDAFYDQLKLNGQIIPLRSRSLVGLLPLIAVEILEEEKIQRLPGFSKRMNWFIENRPDLARLITWCETCPTDHQRRMLAIPSRERLESVLRYMLDQSEFFSPFGIRSVSAVHREKPYVFRVGDHEYRVDYWPGEGKSYLFGGNSNWRGPIWFPINFLLVEALERYHHFYGDTLKVECLAGSGRFLTLGDVATELSRRLGSLFLPNSEGARPCHGTDFRYVQDPNWRGLVLFYEYFHADTGRGCGASHQTGWTSLAVRCLEHFSQASAQ
jgi:hypothetical protein